MHQGLEKRAGRQHDGPRAVARAAPAHDAGNPAPFDRDRFDHLLAEREVLLAFDRELGQELISFLVALGSRAMHRGPFAAIEQAKLKRGRVGKQAHRAAQGIDLTDDLPLGHAADGWVAAHLPDGIAVDGQKCGPHPHAGRRQGRFQPSVARTHHDDVELVRITHPTILGDSPSLSRTVRRTFLAGTRTILTDCDRKIPSRASLSHDRLARRRDQPLP